MVGNNIEKPENVKEEHLLYLDELRETSVTNMIMADTYLQKKFILNKKDASAIVFYWLETFNE